jgi:glycosyltransferase involved in cell wall biosynthesis
MSKRIILFAVPDFKGGGAERVFLNIIKNISRDIFEIHIVVGLLEGQYCQYLPDDVHIHQVGNFKSISSVLFIIKVVWSIRPNVVFSTLEYAVASSLASIFFPKNTKCISRFGNTLTPYLQKFVQANFVKYLYQYFINKCVFYFSDCVVVQSDYMRDDAIALFKLKKKYSNKIIKIHNPIDIKDIVENSLIPLGNSGLNIDNSCTNFVSVGRLTFQKGYKNLIKAFSVVHDRHSNTRLIILGDGDLRKPLESLIGNLNLSNVVLLPGFIENPYSVISKMNIFISSSVFEGVSNAMLESLALGLPVLATDCPSGVREVISNNENGWLVKTDGNIVNNLSDTMIHAIKHHMKMDMKTEKDKIHKQHSISYIMQEYNKIFLS